MVNRLHLRSYFVVTAVTLCFTVPVTFTYTCWWKSHQRWSGVPRLTREREETGVEPHVWKVVNKVSCSLILTWLFYLLPEIMTLWLIYLPQPWLWALCPTRTLLHASAIFLLIDHSLHNPLKAQIHFQMCNYGTAPEECMGVCTSLCVCVVCVVSEASSEVHS